MLDIYISYVKLETSCVITVQRSIYVEGNGIIKPFYDKEKYMFVLPVQDMEKYFLTIKELYPHVKIYEEKSYFQEKGQEDIQKGQ